MPFFEQPQVAPGYLDGKKRKRSFLPYHQNEKYNSFIIGLRQAFLSIVPPQFLHRKVKPHYTYQSSFFDYSVIPVNVPSKNDWKEVPEQSTDWQEVPELPEND